MIATKANAHLHNIWSRNIFPVSMEGCVLYLPLWQEDMQGTTLLSYDPYIHSSTKEGATWGSQGRIFDGIDDNIKVPDHVTLDITSRITIEAWYKSDNDQNGTVRFVVAKLNDAGDTPIYMLSFDHPTANWRGAFTLYDGSWHLQDNQLVISKDVFHHHVGTYDGTNIRTFLDGEIGKTKEAIGLTINTSTGDLYLARDRLVSPRLFDGIIGEVRIYNRALTPQEVQWNYQVTKRRYV